MISQGKKVIEERLQRKREQCIHQKEKLEQMKCTMQKTEEEVEQLEYVLHEIEHIEKSKREPRVIPNAEISNVFASLCREFDYLQHRLKLFFKYIYNNLKLIVNENTINLKIKTPYIQKQNILISINETH